MKILFLAPNPFYSDRGTPIDVDLVLKVLSERGAKIDLLTYHEGRNIEYLGVKIYRIPKLFFVKNIRAGFSWGKIVCDICMVFILIPLLFKNRYNVVHALEESVYMAWLIKIFLRIPYVYDMDSSLAQQMIEKYSFLKPFSAILSGFEKMAVKGSLAVIPCCPELGKIAEQYDSSKKVCVVQDISFLNENSDMGSTDFRESICCAGTLLMYTGNMEGYQGIDLLLEGFQKALEKDNSIHLVLIGGHPEDIEKYKKKTEDLKINEAVHFLGEKPRSEIENYLKQADILISPRTKGKNTPLKIFSYLHSGKPVLATKILSHTQVLNDSISLLAEPNPDDFSQAVIRLIEDRLLRIQLGDAGKKYAEENHTFPVFRRQINAVYDWIEANILKTKQTCR